jgi:hypothetical protein
VIHRGEVHHQWFPYLSDSNPSFAFLRWVLVAQVRNAVNRKDSFTRMKEERERIHDQRIT